MKNMKRTLRDQEGFTLIEIIAVLAILAILAVVAIPRYMGMQNQAQINAGQGAIAAGVSNLSMAYSQCLLENGGTAPTGAVTATGTLGNCASPTANPSVGDFTVTYGGTLPTATVTINTGPSWWSGALTTSVGTKTVYFQ